MRSDSFLRAGKQFVVVTVLAVCCAWVQDTSEYTAKITSVEPAVAKVGTNVTLHGASLGKKTVVAVFVSTATEDFAATVVEQSDNKILIKVPNVKPGEYKASIQVQKTILIQPIRLTVQE
jgi:hypothetical protein